MRDHLCSAHKWCQIHNVYASKRLGGYSPATVASRDRPTTQKPKTKVKVLYGALKQDCHMAGYQTQPQWLRLDRPYQNIATASFHVATSR